MHAWHFRLHIIVQLDESHSQGNTFDVNFTDIFARFLILTLLRHMLEVYRSQNFTRNVVDYRQEARCTLNHSKSIEGKTA
jgi:hypothetical protein